MRLSPTLLLLAALLGLSQCKHANPAPVDQLPPATQAGANTFGCLVNGQAWTPRGNAGFSNYQVDFDPTYKGGTLIIHTVCYDNAGINFQSIHFGGVSVNQIGDYALHSPTCYAEFSDTGRPSACSSYPDGQSSSCQGNMTVTRMDRSAGIVSGTFSFTLAHAGCDTIKVTQGRFDKKL
jgi:hypothetical protein